MKGLAASGLTLAMLALGAGAAQAQTPQLENGKTKAVYDYKTAIRERVLIPQPGIDVDRNGKMDYVTADVIRPAASSATNKMPAIIDPSPYYVTSCRGNEAQCMSDWNNDNVNDRWPLFYDNYFLPRGYAYVLAQMNGTGYTEEGCPMHGGPTDIAGEKSVVDWLNGRVVAYKPKAGTSTTPDLDAPVVADWHNGSSAMIGKSYDGTLSNGVAATGVEGLKTIVPISAISAWYNYSRRGGIRQNSNYPGGSLNPGITYPGTAPSGHAGGINLPNRRGSAAAPTACWNVNQEINNDANEDTGDGDSHGDINKFWNDRDYVKDASKVKAAVFATHGFQDDNVKMDHMAMWWDALGKNNVPRKLWLLRAGHEDPFDSRRAEWVDTLHRWFDHYLYGVDNGIEKEPAVSIEDESKVWKDYASWPIPGTQNVDLFLRATSDPAAAGTLGGKAGGGAADSLGYTALTTTNENALMNSPTGSQANRRVFLSGPLKADLRLSGTAIADLAASIGATQTNFSVIVGDYGVLNADGTRQAFRQVSRTNDEGLATQTRRSCWGDAGLNAVTGEAGTPCETLGAACTLQPREVDNACYAELDPTFTDGTQWRVTRGVRDSTNRDSLVFGDPAVKPVTIGEKFRVPVVTMATEHIFKAGHQVAIIVGGTNTSDVNGTGNNNVAVTLDTRTSKVTLPLVGGYAAAAKAGLTDAETEAPTLGAVPADIATATTDKTGTTVSYTLPTATDNEDPNPVVTCDPASGSKFAVGTTTVTCVAKDANGNTSAPKTFKVVVRQDVPVTAPVGGSVPATLALTLGAPAQLGSFVPGVNQTYLGTTEATVTSTAGDALLSVADTSTVGTGHLVNGAFVLPEPLQLRARNAANTGTAYNNVGSLLNLLSWSAPVANDKVNLEFSQLVKANDPLRTGTYSKSLTFTLSTTQP
ncbi:CocE/NonD family hydrolase [Solirubrobacter pauli]|uniref:CocE/NonD family hydrolase n=1 Tax=Solirubrobacter pauli TaxID=166793 RepID=UPI001477219D|nr:CocE/NonD family hydrolase [Solirubrobacter pauli]